MALRVDSIQELEQAKRRLIDAEIEVRGVTTHDGFVHSIYYFDPKGIWLEL